MKALNANTMTWYAKKPVLPTHEEIKATLNNSVEEITTDSEGFVTFNRDLNSDEMDKISALVLSKKG